MPSEARTLTSAIEVHELVRTFSCRNGKDHGGSAGQVTALDGVSMRVRRNEVHGLLGPNGAGKTTLVKILSTVLLPTSGLAWVFGHDVVSSPAWVRERIGVAFGGERGLYGRLSPRKNLEYWASLYRLGYRAGRIRVGELIAQFGLRDFADIPVDRLSRGMKQRVHLARGMLSHPDLLFLDEPTAGMDPVAAREFRRLFAEFRADGVTVLLTTHDMSEAEQLCDMVTLIDHGRVLGSEPPRETCRWITPNERVEALAPDPLTRARLSQLPGVAGLEPLEDDGWVRISTRGPAAVSAVLQFLVTSGITTLRVAKPSLEEVYLELIGEERGLKV
jgi:ABC-2 type transport system ATP-binding protein